MSKHIPSPRRTRELALNGLRRDPHLTPIHNKPLETADDAAIKLLKLSFKKERESDTGIMGTLESGSSDEKISALKALQQIACGTPNDGQALALRASAPALLAMLPGDSEQAAVATCEALGALAAVESNSDMMREEGILEALISLLPGGAKADAAGKKLQTAAMQALAPMMLFAAGNRQAAKELGMVKTLVEIMKDAEGNQAITADASAALHTLSFDQNIPNEIIAAGGLKCIVDAISTGAQGVSVALKPGNPIPKSRQLVTSCLGILTNLVAVDGTRDMAIEAGVVEVSVSTVLATAAHSTDTSISALTLLMDLASEPRLQDALLRSDLVMRMLLGLTHPMESWNRKEASAQLAAKAALILCKLATLGGSQALEVHQMGFTKDLIAMAKITPQHNVGSGTSDKGYATEDTVAICVEASLNALAAICVSEKPQEFALKEGLMETLAVLMTQHSRHLRASSARLIQELAQSPKAHKEVARHRVVVVLVNEIIDHMGGACEPRNSCILEAVAALRSIAFNDGGSELIMESSGTMPLLAVLEHGTTIACRSEAAHALRNMACLSEAIPEMAENGAAAGAVRMLKEMQLMSQRQGGSDMSHVTLQAVGLLRNLVSDPHDVDTTTTVVDARALGVLVPLLDVSQQTKNSAKVFVQAASALNNISISFHCESLCTDTMCLSLISTFLMASSRGLAAGENGAEWEEGAEQMASIVYNGSLYPQLRPKMKSSGALKSMVNILSWRPNNIQIISLVCTTIANFVVDAEMKTAVAAEGAVQMLIGVLQDPAVSGAHAEACTALHNMAANSEEVKRDQLAAGAAPALISLCKIKKGSAEIHQKAAKALNMLANKNKERRDLIVAAGGSEFLTKLPQHR